jgi:CheY-like chemotaxis protein
MSPVKTGHLKALVVNDSEDGAESFAVVLGLCGCEAKVLYGADDVVREAVAFLPHVIFIDVRMPRVDGCEAARRIRRESVIADVWLIAASGSSSVVTVRESEAAGFDAYYLTPIDPSVLGAILARASLERRSRSFVLDPQLAPLLRSPSRT